MTMMLKIDYANPPHVLGCLPEQVMRMLALPISDASQTVILPKNIIAKHIKKHEPDFASWESFKQHVELMPEILTYPDYAGYHPYRCSIRLVKRLDAVMVLALRLTQGEHGLEVRKLFPISASKLQLWIASGDMLPVNLDRPHHEG